MEKVSTIHISKLDEIISFVDLSGDFYWRGQENCKWGLKTNLERQVDKTKSSPSIEQRILREFKRKEHLFSSENVPKNDFERIAKIQHYGGPTRLLDFTRSFLKALYFSVADLDEENDGAIWGIGRGYVNGPHERQNVANMQNEIIFRQTSDHFSECLNGTLKERTVTFLEPFSFNKRLHVQQGLFAMPLDISVRFIENLNALFDVDIYQELLKNIISFKDSNVERARYFPEILKAKVVKMIVPKKLKRGLKLRLKDAYGISSESLFPGIDGFCKSLVGNFESVASSFRYD